MLKQAILAAFLATAPLAGPVAAQASLQDQVVAQLRDQGFREIRISRTLLGRVRIVATNAEMRREVVINPATGLILRDYWVVLDGDDDDDGSSSSIFESDRSGSSGGSSGSSGSSGSGSGGGSGSGDDDDDDDDDSDDDDDDDDDD